MTAGSRRLLELLDALPQELKAPVFTHSSWTETRSDSYERLAFLGDGVLGTVVADALLERLPQATAGDLTKIRAQAASRVACARVAESLDVAGRLTANAPEQGELPLEDVVGAQSVLAEVCEAVIGAVFLHHGYAQTAEAVAAAFADEISAAEAHPADHKSALQELLARSGRRPEYVVTAAEGPAHDRRFECAVEIRGDRYGTGSGRSKKEAEQAAAGATLEMLDSSTTDDTR